MVLSDNMVHFLKIEKNLTNLPKLSCGFKMGSRQKGEGKKEGLTEEQDRLYQGRKSNPFGVGNTSR